MTDRDWKTHYITGAHSSKSHPCVLRGPDCAPTSEHMYTYPLLQHGFNFTHKDAHPYMCIKHLLSTGILVGFHMDIETNKLVDPDLKDVYS